MAITVTDAVVETGPTTAGTSHTINLSNAVVGDLRVVIINANPNGTGATPIVNLPSGWTALGTQQETGAASTGVLWAIYRLFVGGDSGSVTITNTNNCQMKTFAITYEGVDTTTPIDQTTPAYDVTENPPTSPAITTQTDNAWLVVATNVDGSPGTWSAAGIPTGFTSRGFDANNPPANGQNVHCGDMDAGTLGAKGSFDWNQGGSEEAVSLTFAIRETQVSYEVVGDVRDLNLDTVGTVRCILLKHDGAAEASRVYSVIDHVNANGSGLYTFAGLGDNDSRYMVIAYNDEATDRRGVTNDNLTPVLE